MPKWLICCGMRRSGSTLQYLIVKRILEITGKGISKGYAENEDVIKTLETSTDDNYEYILLKTHDYQEIFGEMDKDNQALFFYTYRDIRDVMVSAMNKWFDGNFLACYYSLNSKIKTADSLWRNMKNIHISSYENITGNLKEEIARTANFLNISIADHQITEIHNELNINSLKSRIKRFDYKNKGIYKNSGVIDPETNLHQNHINSGDLNQWKIRLDSFEIATIQKDWSKWLIENNYGLFRTLYNFKHIYNLKLKTDRLFRKLMKKIKIT